ncbi:MAG TPA: hypothetical protein VHT05_12470 [Candidatus Elarobacter sp.]|nr:hypothetical protein [Candidatus Elarobacter sp.]
MKRAPLPGLDLGVYVSALPKLARNPSIIVVPLLMAIIGVLLTVTMASFSAGGVGSLTLGLAQLIELLLGLFGLGTACVIADDAWRHGRASFERGWTETQRRSGEIMMAAIGFGLLTSVALYLTQIVGLVGYLLTAVVIVFLIWTIPAAAVGGIPGGAAIQVSIERVRARPIPAIVATVVALVLLGYVVPLVGSWIASLLLVWTVGSLLPELLIVALFQSIAVSYIALVITKIYTDDAFSTRRY